MAFRYLQLLFPVLVGLRNVEEAILLPRWTQRSGPWLRGATPGALRFALAAFTALAVVVTVLSALRGARTFWAEVTFGYMIAMLINAVFPHISVSVAERSLMPGVITAATLNLPILPLLAVLAIQQGYVAAHDGVVYSVATGLLLLLMIPLLLKLGELLGF
ncbi:MAG: HXXEE domain-containing protein [Acidobacteriota bacterium]